MAEGGLRLWELDEYQIINPEVIAHWIGRLGFIPLICILVVVARSFREAGAVVSILNTIGGIAVVSLVIGIGVPAFGYVRSVTRPANDLSWQSGPARTDFVWKALERCGRKQRSIPVNRNFVDPISKDFCGSVAYSL